MGLSGSRCARYDSSELNDRMLVLGVSFYSIIPSILLYGLVYSEKFDSRIYLLLYFTS